MIEGIVFVFCILGLVFGSTWIGYSVAAHKYLITADVQRGDTNEYITTVELVFIPNVLAIGGKFWKVEGSVYSENNNNVLLFVSHLEDDSYEDMDL